MSLVDLPPPRPPSADPQGLGPPTRGCAALRQPPNRRLRQDQDPDRPGGARLLLGRPPSPRTVLCVTYTKAAAAEMQRRLYELLGSWSVREGQRALRQARLADLEGRAGGPLLRPRRPVPPARALFRPARWRTPGGLKIQTIHAFSAKKAAAPLSAGGRRLARLSRGPWTMAASAAVAEAAKRGRVARHALRGRKAAVARGPYAAPSSPWPSNFMSFPGDVRRPFEARRGALARFLARARPAWAGANGLGVGRPCGFRRARRTSTPWPARAHGRAGPRPLGARPPPTRN